MPRSSHLLRIRRLMAGTAAVAFSTLFAPALSAADLPAFLADLHAKPVGTVAGLPAWQVDGQDMLWMAMPDGTVIAGYAFDRQGNDIGSSLTGFAPVGAVKSILGPDPAAAAAAETLGGASAASWDDLVREAAPEAADLPPLDIVTAPIGAEPRPDASLLPPVPPVPAAAPQAPAAPAAGADPQGLLANATSITEQALKGLPEEKKQELIADLVRHIEAAKTPEQFQLAIIRWNEKVTGKAILPEGFALPDGTTGLEPLAVDAPAHPEAAAPAPGAQKLSFDRANPTNETLLQDIRQNGYWFGVGAHDAPVVYMIADPTCPVCARSAANLRPRVEAGQLQLRVLLAPVLSRNSPGQVSAILQSPDVAGAWWTHSLEVAAKGISSLPPKSFQELPEAKVNAVRGNFDLLNDYGLKGVPFFAWDTATGPKFLSGAAEAGSFEGAIADAWDGAH
ncbi:thioredoxin fold domain-containing protein [Cereibacter sphaeroides]|uniref:thioredoxin fold domain-containing protein n=1 Tax=Cereibacter sphaeroides TaxID=1063 RepID=UPI001F4552E0|nr:thioredoxin fold domain-containing protein [Cereibacter sphaeroides]MCE6958793.1 thioredoxin fold domain-containing protein [Cereibacter sphaeroides]MCE6973333.1 thioredoxin fold domain-containing protein [Cereibacter sphaeroides]